MKTLPDLFIDEQELEERGFTLLPNLVSATDLAEFERVIGEFCSAEIKRREITPQYPDPFVDVMLADEEYRRYLFPLLRRFFILERISTQIGARLTQNGFLARHGHRAPIIGPSFGPICRMRKTTNSDSTKILSRRRAPRLGASGCPCVT